MTSDWFPNFSKRSSILKAPSIGKSKADTIAEECDDSEEGIRHVGLVRNANKPIKISIAAIVLAAVAFLCQPRYYVSECLSGDVEVLWKNGTGFMKVGNRTSGIQGPLIALAWNWLGSLAGTSATVRQGVKIWTLQSNGVTLFEFKDIPSEGTLFPYDKDVYYLVGTTNLNEWPLLWRWQRSSLLRVEREKALTIVNAFSQFSEVVAHEGWKWQQLYFGSPEALLSDDSLVGGFDVRLVQKDTSNGQNRKLLCRRGNPRGTETSLLECSTDYVRINRQEYHEKMH